MADASLTNMNMVRPKGPKVFLGVLALAGLGAAAWWFTQPDGPIGEVEQPHKILIVGGDDKTAEMLGQVGFEARQGEFDALAAEGGGEGAEAIIKLADEQGYGYVAIQHPVEHKVSLKVSGDSADVGPDDEWAVFSVGDMGVPPRVTIDEEPSHLPLPDFVHVLRAAFVQERLAGTLFAESQLPMDAVELHAKVQAAIELRGRYAVLDREVNRRYRERTEALHDDEKVEPPAVMLAKALEHSTPIPLGNGGVLTMVKGQRLDSPWTTDVELQRTDAIDLYYYPPGVSELDARTKCESLRGGVLSPQRDRLALSRDGRRLLLEGTDTLEMWRLDDDSKDCAFSREGTFPLPTGYEQDWGTTNSRGELLRAGSAPEEQWLHIWTHDTPEPNSMKLPGCTLAGMPVWLDDDHVIVSCEYEPPEPDEYDYEDDLDLDAELPDDAEEPAPPPIPEQSWIYIVRVADQRILAIAGTEIDEDVHRLKIRPVPNDQGTLDVLAGEYYGPDLYRISTPATVESLFAAREADFATLAARVDQPEPEPEPEPSETDPAEGEAEADGGEIEPPLLTPEFVPWASAVVVAHIMPLEVIKMPRSVNGRTMRVSYDGKTLLYVTPDGTRVELFTLANNDTTTIADNDTAAVERAMLTFDGKGVVFTSEVESRRHSEDSQYVGRYAALPTE